MRARNAFSISLVSLLAMALGTGAGLVWYRHASMPAHDGEFTVVGLSAPVTIARDAEGVPHISASSEADALFALGYSHAQDRLWQLDFNRRVAQGRLSETLGRAALDTDRYMRTLGLHRAARAIASNLDAETRSMLDAYAAGVNAYLGSRSGPLPPEFLLTRTPPPAPWDAANSIEWSLLIALDLSRTWQNELARLQLSARLTKAEIDDFRPPYPGETPLVTSDYVTLYRDLGLLESKLKSGGASLVSQAVRLAGLDVVHPLGADDGVGSNNWVVAGDRSASGKPILANDPHLRLTTPSVWYVARLSAPGLDVFGATFPGMPYVVLGRNARLAWGATNTGPDVQDFYIERINSQDPSTYETPAGFERFTVREEVIKVRGEDDVRFVVRGTRHGPVLSDALDETSSMSPRYVLALRWTALQPEDHTMRAIRRINRAGSAAEFIEATRDWTLVQQNFVFADDAGRIGFVAPGRIPVRRPDNELKGLVPMPGWAEKYDWTGWLRFEDLPLVVDPPSGRIATANHKIVGSDWPHFLTSEWYLPYRVQRIEELLDATPKHTPESMRAIQADVTSLAARDFIATLRALDLKPKTAAGSAALERLLAWDGSMRVDASEPALFHTWMRALRERIFADELGPLAKEFVLETENTDATLRVLRGQAAARDWCDDVTTLDRHETCRELAAETLDGAAAQLATNSGHASPDLRWGDLHRAVLAHQVMSKVPIVGELFELSTAYPGDTYTINVGKLSMQATAPFVARFGVSFRAIYDLSAPASGYWIYATGQAGHPLSDHYDDLLARWQAAKPLPVRWEAPKGQGAPYATLFLLPAAPAPRT